jgi:hypothetical protein
VALLLKGGFAHYEYDPFRRMLSLPSVGSANNALFLRDVAFVAARLKAAHTISLFGNARLGRFYGRALQKRYGSAFRNRPASRNSCGAGDYRAITRPTSEGALEPRRAASCVYRNRRRRTRENGGRDQGNALHRSGRTGPLSSSQGRGAERLRRMRPSG